MAVIALTAPTPPTAPTAVMGRIVVEKDLVGYLVRLVEVLVQVHVIKQFSLELIIAFSQFN